VKYFLLKPYTAETLLRLFRDVLDSKPSPKSADLVGHSPVPFNINGRSLHAGEPRDHAVR
jgi:hypothetical protein